MAVPRRPLLADAGVAGAAAVGAIGVIVLVPILLPDSGQMTIAIQAAATFIAALGFNIAFGSAGVMAIGHAAFALLGAYTVALSHSHWDLPPVPAVVLATVLCGVVGVITALPALKMGQFAIAVITVLYLGALSSLILYFDSFTGGASGVPSPTVDFDNRARWFLVAGVAAVCFAASRNLIRSPLGSNWQLAKLEPRLAEGLGVNVTHTKLIAVGIASALAGLAGSFWPLINGYTTVETYTISYMVLVFLIVVIGGAGSVFGPLLGSAFVAGISLVQQAEFSSGGTTAETLYGVAVLGTILIAPGGIASIGRAVGERARRGSASSVADAAVDDEVPFAFPRVAGVPLEARGISLAIGGTTILADAAISARPGSVRGLIGPNGAGKTTLLNCISGFVRPDAGEVTFAGKPLLGSASRRARHGIGRTFQNPLLLEEASVVVNALSGRERVRTVGPLRYMFRTPAARREARDGRAEARGLAAMVGLDRVAHVPAKHLSPGQRRQLEIIRLLAMEPSVILLDEPAAGLSGVEIQELERLIRAMAAAGATVILIEHHLNLVLAVSDDVTVLDAGRVIFEGPAVDAPKDPAVIAAYIGADAAAEVACEPTPEAATRSRTEVAQ